MILLPRFEQTDIVKKWEKTNLLLGLDEVCKKNCARLLENQLIYNQKMAIPHLHRMSIPIIRRIYSHSQRYNVEFGTTEDRGVKKVFQVYLKLSDVPRSSNSRLEREINHVEELAEIITNKIDAVEAKQGYIKLYYLEYFTRTDRIGLVYN